MQVKYKCLKKTLIALLALSSLAMGETTTVTTDVTPTKDTFDGYKHYTVPEGKESEWKGIGWGGITADVVEDNLTTDFALLGITSAGDYAFGSGGGAINTTYPAISFTNDGKLTLTGRPNTTGDTFYASVVDVSTILGGATTADLTALSITTTVVNGTGSDSWWGLYKMDATGQFTEFANIRDNGLSTLSTDTITLTDAQVAGLTDTDKLVAFIRQGGGGKTVDITGLKYTATLNVPVTPPTPGVPEPTTATLSLLALAGLAARRRRK